jgi:myo-inositol-1(or 4)-monophosphatase
MNLNDIVTIAAAIAQDAGELIMRHYAVAVTEKVKSTSIDIVTAADTEAEALIVSALTSHFPDHHIVGEEGGGMGASADSAEYFWHVDPIDGTVNFAAKLPHFCTSIALCDKNREPLVGVVYDPTRKELFKAIRGEGAWLNDQPLRVTAVPRLLQAVLSTGFPYDRHTNPDNNLKEWTAFLVRTRGERRLGSAALDFSWVAAGRLDGYWEKSLNTWDVMAGLLLVREAGGRVTDYQGGEKPQALDKGGYVVSNGHIHQEMLEVIASVS